MATSDNSSRTPNSQQGGEVSGKRTSCKSTQPGEGESEEVIYGRTEIEIKIITVKSQSDTQNCSITGIELMDNDNLVLVDANNKSVKTFALRLKVVTHQLEVDDKPGDVTKVDKDTVAVAFVGSSVIQLISVSASRSLSLGRQIHIQYDSLSLGQQIQIHVKPGVGFLERGGCSGGLQYFNTGGGRVVVCLKYEPEQILIINMSGTVLKKWSFDSMGMFKRPFASDTAVNQNDSIVYVSHSDVFDAEKDRVTAMTLDGNVVFTYRDDQLSNPSGLTAGKNGEIYVCGMDSHNVHMVSGDGKKIQILYDENDGLKYPLGIMYNRTDNKLYVGMHNNNNVYVFKLAA